MISHDNCTIKEYDVYIVRAVCKPLRLLSPRPIVFVFVNIRKRSNRNLHRPIAQRLDLGPDLGSLCRLLCGHYIHPRLEVEVGVLWIRDHYVVPVNACSTLGHSTSGKVELTSSASCLALCGHGFPSVLGLCLLYQILLALVLLSDCFAFTRGCDGGLVRDAVKDAKGERGITKNLARRPPVSTLMAGSIKTGLSIVCEKPYIDAGHLRRLNSLFSLKAGSHNIRINGIRCGRGELVDVKQISNLCRHLTLPMRK